MKPRKPLKRNIAKKLAIIPIIIIFIISFSIFSYAKACDVAQIKDVLRKILHLYLTEPQSVSLTKDEIRDLLAFYVSISGENLTADCSAFGHNSNRPIYGLMKAAENLPDKIPKCPDNTKYGQCSINKPGYCRAGTLYDRCDICGCPANSFCLKSGKCQSINQNIQCYKDIDCSQSSFTGEYYCTNGYISRTYINYTCVNPGTVNSKCISTNSSVLLTYCNPSLNEACVQGFSTCHSIITDAAPTVSISISPEAVTQGQAFNITVSGTDDVGVAYIWWWGINTNDIDLNKEHWYYCNNTKVCSNTWQVKTNATGTLQFAADSRDTSYPVTGQPHQASEAVNLAYDTVTVSAAPKTNVRCSIDYFYYLPNDVTCTATYNGQSALCTIAARNSWGHICDPLPLIMIEQPSPNVGFMPVPGLSGTFNGISCSKVETVYNTNYYFVNCIGPYNNHTLEGDDGSWCTDLDKANPYFTKSYCQDKNGTYYDFCDSGTVRDYYCTGTWTGSAWNNVRCEHGGYSCASGGYNCIDGACTNQTVITALTIKGRLIDYFTKNPIANALVYTWDGQTRHDVYTSTNGEFVITANATSVTQSSPKPFGINPTCFNNMGFALFRNADGSLYVNVQINNLIGSTKTFPVTSSEVNLGDIPMWPAVSIELFSDIPVYFRILYDSFVGSGNLGYKTYHYLSYSVPLNASVTIKTTDSANASYTSPQINLPRNWGCTTVKLNFSTKQFNWIVPAQITIANQTLASPTRVNADFSFSYDLSRNTALVTPTISFEYPQANITNYNIKSFRLYNKKPGETVFTKVAEFTNLPTTSSSATTTLGEWKLVFTFPPSGWSIFKVTSTGQNDHQPASNYATGAHSYYVSAVDANGKESAPSVISTINVLDYITILSPTATQSPVSATPTFKWTLPSGWPSYTSPTYIIFVIDSSTNNYLWKGYQKGNGSLVYSGPTLDPAKRYYVMIQSEIPINEQEMYFTISSNLAQFWVVNQTACTDVSKTIDFENPPHLSFHLTWNPDLGTQDSYNYNLDETARQWLKPQGININGTPNGIVWGTGISGAVGKTGVVIGFASPSFIENDEGISDNEILIVRFLNNSVKSATLGLTTTPSDSSLINNVPSTVIMEAYNSAGSLVASSSKTFTGVSNGVYTPTTINVSSFNFNIAKITLRTTQHPYGGIWLEDIRFKVSCT